METATTPSRSKAPWLILVLIYLTIGAWLWDTERPGLSFALLLTSMLLAALARCTAQLTPGFAKAFACFVTALGAVYSLVLLADSPHKLWLIGPVGMNASMHLRDRFGVGRPRLLQLTIFMVCLTAAFEPWHHPSIFYVLVPVYIAQIIASLIYGGEWLEFADERQHTPPAPSQTAD